MKRHTSSWLARMATPIAVVSAIALSLNSVWIWGVKTMSAPDPWRVAPANWAPLRNGSILQAPQSGQAGAEVLIFSDYGCPSCKELFEAIARRPAGEVKRGIRVLQLPPSGSRESEETSIAAICGARIGRFAEIHAALFAIDPLTPLPPQLPAIEAAAGITDTLEFRACLHSPEARSELDMDLASAASLGLDATPSVIIDGAVYRGAPRHLFRTLRTHVR